VASPPRSGVLAIIPARSGSKSVPHKNLRPFRGKPLIAHSIGQALAARNVDRVIVSTDSPDYARIAREFGAEAPFLRPDAIAQDLSTDLDVFLHALDWLEANEHYRPELCVHLRPTYPLRSVADVEGAVDLLRGRPDADSVRSVTPAPHTPYKMWRLDDAGGLLRPLLESDIPEAYNMARQALPPVYLQNAAVDVVRAEVVQQRRSMTGARILAYPMPEIHDIDTEFDFAAAGWARSDAPPRGKTFAVALAALLAQGTEDDLDASSVHPGVAAILERLHALGNTILVHTVRTRGPGGDATEPTHRWLAERGVKYHRVVWGKPRADFHIDDGLIPLFALQRWLGQPD
jgi:CMP-N,N'-diacetyllegionaminic acid synthase